METSKKTQQSGYGIGATYGPNYGIGATYGDIFHWGYILKQNLVVVQTPEWKFRQVWLEMPHLKVVQA